MIGMLRKELAEELKRKKIYLNVKMDKQIYKDIKHIKKVVAGLEFDKQLKNVLWEKGLIPERAEANIFYKYNNLSFDEIHYISNEVKRLINKYGTDKELLKVIGKEKVVSSFMFSFITVNDHLLSGELDLATYTYNSYQKTILVNKMIEIKLSSIFNGFTTLLLFSSLNDYSQKVFVDRKYNTIKPSDGNLHVEITKETKYYVCTLSGCYNVSEEVEKYKEVAIEFLQSKVKDFAYNDRFWRL